MRRDDLAAELAARQGADGTVFPAYDDYCFAGVPRAVYDLLDGDVGPTLPDDVGPALPDDAFDPSATSGNVERVVVVLVDGFGYDQWRRAVDDVPLLERVEEAGTVTPLTSVFPSETAAAMTTYHTARYPHEHGILGWFQRVPGLDDVVLPFPFTTADGRDLPDAYPEFAREDLFLADAHYDRTAAAGVETRQVVPAAIAGTACGATGYDGLDDFAEALGDSLADSECGSVTFAYLPQVDAVSHAVGTGAAAYRETLASVADAVSRGLTATGGGGDEADRADHGLAAETLVVLTADHGHLDTDPAANVDLREPRFAPLWGLFERRADGRAVPPTGSPRQLHLHLRDEEAEPKAHRLLGRELDALVLSREEAIAREFRGPGEYGETFRERCGDLLVVPGERGVWYDGDELALVGMHGGLTREEMLVPFASARLADLR